MIRIANAEGISNLGKGIQASNRVLRDELFSTITRQGAVIANWTDANIEGKRSEELSRQLAHVLEDARRKGRR